MEGTCSIPPVGRGDARGFALVVAALVLVAVGKAVLSDTLDPDLFWHLRVADRLAALPFPRPIVDDLSFSSLRTPWTPYSWLAELAMKKVWDFDGYRAAVLAQGLMAGGMVVFTALAAVEMTAARHGRPRYLAAAVAAAAAEFISLPYVSFRPVTLAMLLLAIGAWLLQRDRRLGESSRAVWLVVPLTIVLTNVHLFAAFMPASVFALCAGAWWERRRERREQPRTAHPVELRPRPQNTAHTDETFRRLQRYIILLFATSLAYLMTPMLPGVLKTALGYQFTDVMVSSPVVVIAELKPFWQGTTGPIAVAFVLAVVACAAWSRKTLRAGEWAILLGSFLVLMRLGRFTPVFALFAAPMLAAAAPRLSDAVLGRRFVHVALAALLAASVIRVARGFPPSRDNLSHWLDRLGPDSPGYPTAAADFVAARVTPRTHHLIGEFTWGGYLEYRLGDTYQVLLDGRTQVFPAELWKALYLGTPARRKACLATIPADAAILPTRGSAFREDLLDLGWRITYADARAQVLVPPAN